MGRCVLVRWYNTQHLHSAIRFVTPDDRHTGRDIALLLARRAVYLRARKRTPERWSGSIRTWEPLNTVRLNPDHDEVAAPARVALTRHATSILTLTAHTRWGDVRARG